jgi:hypothetical protein
MRPIMTGEQQPVSEAKNCALCSLVTPRLPANSNCISVDFWTTCKDIASAEGNVVALKVLVEHGANVSAQDRWGNTIYDEAKRSNAGQLLAYLKTFQGQQQQAAEESDGLIMDV